MGHFVGSKVADPGMSFEDVSRVIEYDRLEGRAGLGQRELRMRHGAGKGEFHILLQAEPGEIYRLVEAKVS